MCGKMLINSVLDLFVLIKSLQRNMIISHGNLLKSISLFTDLLLVISIKEQELDLD